MLFWLSQNIATIIICAVLLVIVAAILCSIARGHKKGVSSCGCGCSSCPMSGECHSKKSAKHT